jgi:ABC-type branched-subunit amino acid transport system permease subunit
MAVGAYLSGYPVDRVMPEIPTRRRSCFYVALFVTVGIAGAVCYGVLARATGVHSCTVVADGVLLFAVGRVRRVARVEVETPPVPARHAEGSRSATAVVSHHRTAARAAMSKLSALRRPRAALLQILLDGGGLCAAARLIVGLPTLRLRGDYLAIATLGLPRSSASAIQNAKPLGGRLGSPDPTYTTFGWLFGASSSRSSRSGASPTPTRAGIQAVREDEDRRGGDWRGPDAPQGAVVRRRLVFSRRRRRALRPLHGFITLAAGVGTVRSIEFVVMVTLGGLASISGAILAAMCSRCLPRCCATSAGVVTGAW